MKVVMFRVLVQFRKHMSQNAGPLMECLITFFNNAQLDKTAEQSSHLQGSTRNT